MTATELTSPAIPTATTARSIVMLGASSGPVCGVRDYSRRLSDALADLGVRVVDVWWEIDPEDGLVERHHDLSSWLRRLVQTVESEPAPAIVWQYSVFTYGYRGMPTLVPQVASRLSRVHAPRVGVLHEIAYPFGRRGLRGDLQGAAQRLAFAHAYRVLDAAVLTTEHRKAWLDTRAWLPKRPTTFLPVCSNLPDVATPSGRARPEAPVVGVFGFAGEGYLSEAVLGAISCLRSRALDVGLTLIGAPGPRSSQADVWRKAAVKAGCADALSFTGILAPEAAARALQQVDVLVLPDTGGPSGRKGTLAAALAAGKPVVAFDGPDRWETLIRERVVAITPPEPDGLADAIQTLVGDPVASRSQSARASAFYASRQAPKVIAARLLDFMNSVSAGAAP